MTVIGIFPYLHVPCYCRVSISPHSILLLCDIPYPYFTLLLCFHITCHFSISPPFVLLPYFHIPVSIVLPCPYFHNLRYCHASIYRYARLLSSFHVFTFHISAFHIFVCTPLTVGCMHNVFPLYMEKKSVHRRLGIMLFLHITGC